MLRRVRSVVLPAFAIVVLVTACGGSSSKSDPAADLSLAKGAVLTATDAPAGYTASPHQSSADMPEPVKRDFANCVHADTTVFDTDKDSQNADGPDFKDNNGGSIENSIEIAKAKSTIDKGVKTMQAANVSDCLGKLFDTAIKAEVQKDPNAGTATFGTVTVAPLTVSGVGDRALAFRGTIPVSAAGQSTVFYFDVLLVQRGRAGITLSAFRTGTPPDQALETQLASKMVGRLGPNAP
jgi:hypothetical protein